MENKYRYSNIKIPVYIIIAVIFIWLAFAGLTFYFIPSWNDRSAFGSMFGAISSLFTGIALAGVTYTVYLQQKELSLQRTSLDTNIQQMQESAQAQSSAQKSLNEQIQIQNLALQLSALSSILSHYDQQIGRIQGIERENMEDKVKSLLIDIESLRSLMQNINAIPIK
jgi:hypothetical protein